LSSVGKGDGEFLGHSTEEGWVDAVSDEKRRFKRFSVREKK